MNDELIRLTAAEAVLRLRRREISPLDLIEAAAMRIAEVEPVVNALPTLCGDRARDHAKRLMDGDGRDAATEPRWLAGLPVAIKDLTDVACVRTTYGSPIFRDHVPAKSHPVVERIERNCGIHVFATLRLKTDVDADLRRHDGLASRRRSRPAIYAPWWACGHRRDA